MKNLLKITSDNWGVAKANQLLVDALYDIFAHKRRSSAFFGLENLRTEMITTGAVDEVLFADFTPMNKDAWGELLSNIFAYSVQNNLSLTEYPGFNKWINANGKVLNQLIASGSYNSYWQRPPADFVGIIEAGFITGNSDPEKIYRERYYRNKNSYINPLDVELLHAIARRSTVGMISAVEDTEFTSKVSHPFRGEIFVALASTGTLTAKAARKIRSDSSAEASEKGIRAIAANIGKFKNAAEVLSQVMDTKHVGVASHLANTIPVEYLPFMAVCQDLGVRNIVVNRMQESKNV